MSDVAIITGASSGIGAATAVVFARHGCRLAISGRNMDNLHHTKQECIKAGLKESEVLTVKADMKSEADLKALVDETMKTFGKISILVNNAGINNLSSRSPDSEAPFSEFDDIMDTNVRGLVRLTQLCVPHIKASKGSIVNNSSILSQVQMPGVAYYSMSKAAVDAYTRSLAVELGPHGVRVNSINPGVTKTNIYYTEGIHMTEDDFKDFDEKCSQKTPLGRSGLPEEIGKVIWFLASGDSSFLTGQSIIVDGGVTVGPSIQF